MAFQQGRFKTVTVYRAACGPTLWRARNGWMLWRFWSWYL